MLIRPAKCLRGEVALPGDKSISHRAAMIAAIAEGETRVDNFATSADCASTLSCLRQLGVEVRQDGSTVWIEGAGLHGLRAPIEPLDCGNSGTTMRLLAGILAGQNFESVLIGDESLGRRPMGRIADPLTAMGAEVETTDGHAPLKISGGSHLRGIEYTLPVASGQIKSCILLAGLNASGETAVLEPVDTRDHTERMLRWFGTAVKEGHTAGGHRLSVSGDVSLRAPSTFVVPGDVSAAAFFIAAACLPGSSLRLEHVGLNPTRSAIVEIAQRLGSRTQVIERDESNGEPFGTIEVTGGLERQTVTEVRGAVVANLIDEIPVLAVLGSQLDGGLEIRDAAELRVKESDRIGAVVENLHRMNADVAEFEDGFRVGPSRLKGARVDSFGDHRIAMAFAVAGLMAEGETEIDGAECAAVSFPGFFEVLQNVAIYE